MGKPQAHLDYHLEVWSKHVYRGAVENEARFSEHVNGTKGRVLLRVSEEPDHMCGAELWDIPLAKSLLFNVTYIYLSISPSTAPAYFSSPCYNGNNHVLTEAGACVFFQVQRL